MPAGPRRFIAFARRILSEMVRIEKTIKDQTKAVSETIKTTHAQQNTPQEVIAKIHIPEAVVARKASEDAADDKKYQLRTLFVASLT